MTIRRSEEPEIWQDAIELCKKISLIAYISAPAKDVGLRNQILDSSESVVDHIAEGFDRDGKNEFMDFLCNSEGAPVKTRSQVHRIFDAGHIDENQYKELLED